MRKRERREFIAPVLNDPSRLCFTVRAALVDSQARENRLRMLSQEGNRGPYDMAHKVHLHSFQ